MKKSSEEVEHPVLSHAGPALGQPGRVTPHAQTSALAARASHGVRLSQPLSVRDGQNESK